MWVLEFHLEVLTNKITSVLILIDSETSNFVKALMKKFSFFITKAYAIKISFCSCYVNSSFYNKVLCIKTHKKEKLAAVKMIFY